MKRLTFHTLLSVLLLSLPACKKKSSFQGTVTSSADGKPIKDVEMQLSFHRGVKGGGFEAIGRDIQFTDELGNYAVETETNHGGSGALLAKKEGYAPSVIVRVSPGDCDEINFVIHPYDAWLNVTFENASVTTKQYFYEYTGPFLTDNPYCISICGPYTVQPGEKRSETALIPGGADLRVNWKADNNAIITENVFCPRGDTTFLSIKL